MTLAKKRFQCGSCGEIIEVPQRSPKPSTCPKCGASGYIIHQKSGGDLIKGGGWP